MAKTDFTVGRLRELLHYNARTGLFTWLAKSGFGSSACAGVVAGGEDTPGGYIRIGVMGKRYMAHRLAWLYATDAWPTEEIDHINGVRGDNRWINLRAATKNENQQNQRRAQANNQSGFLGVSPKKNRWQANINTNGKRHYVGSFETEELAYAAYVLAKRALHPRGMI